LVERLDVVEDRRAWRIRLTLKGRNTFRDMAQQHEAWIVSAFDSLSEKEIQTLYKLLGRVKQHTHTTPETETP
jgi:DNA-binding MarR family transcriptional regulator